MQQNFTLLKSLFIALILIPYFGYGQASFEDDFESYEVNSFLCVSSSVWKTWDNKPGTATDVRITDEKAKSGTKSIKLASTSANGGPVDVILPFGGRYTSGRFVYSMSMFVPTGKNGYFNFQGTNVPGTTWSLNGYLNTDGSLALTASNNAPLFSTQFPIDEWFDLTLDINLSINSWKVIVNGECQGTFSNPTNALASVNLYPTNASSIFFVDDVSYSYDPNPAPITNDVSVSNLVWKSGRLTGTEDVLSFIVKNNGSDVINDLELSAEFNEEFEEINLTGINLEPGKTQVLETTIPRILSEGINNIQVLVNNVNGSVGDQEECNNKSSLRLVAVTAAEDKAILAEEATGTWCTWCPRGAVFMDLMNGLYPKRFIPIAVHNNDPMMVTQYDALVRSTPGFGGFPSSILDRRVVVDPSQMENPFISRIVTPTVAKITAGAQFNTTSRTLDISALVEFKTDVTGDFWVNVAVTEDGVRGTGSGYNQVNAYANNANGPMGGYELLPNPVPAALMVYEHVARAIMGLQKTTQNNFIGDFKAGDTKIVNFSIVIPAEFNIDKMNIVPILLSGNGYENASISTIEEAVNNGFLVNSKDEFIIVEDIKAYPNPASDMIHFDMNISQASNVTMELLDVAGKLMLSTEYGLGEGLYSFAVNVSHLQPGVYFTKIYTNQGVVTKKIMVNR